MTTTKAGGGLIAQAVLDSEQGYAQKIRVGHHALTSDEPKSSGGTDSGPAPYGLLLSSLGACTAITLRMYAQRKGWELGAIHIEMRLSKDAGGADHIERIIRLGAGAALSGEQLTKLGEIADKTPVTKTLSAGAAIATTFAAG